ncbi:hypothetical protein KM043_008170 [Ampulex compressa]|nr:hypothetical protein KM043_008170 [Ampulex compressa]
MPFTDKGKLANKILDRQSNLGTLIISATVGYTPEEEKVLGKKKDIGHQSPPRSIHKSYPLNRHSSAHGCIEYPDEKWTAEQQRRFVTPTWARAGNKTVHNNKSTAVAARKEQKEQRRRTGQKRR